MPTLCLDIGNTSGHLAWVDDTQCRQRQDIPTGLLTADDSALPELLETAAAQDAALSYCSVVPTATAALQRLLKDQWPRLRAFQLSYDNCPGLEIDYPTPSEIGADRLAGAIGAQKLKGAPAIIVVLGTATCFDILTAKGYAGGILAPGLALMTDYLHEKTALLPRLDRFALDSEKPWGKSTIEAMQIGCGPGYRGMIDTLLQRILQAPEFAEQTVNLFVTGGNAHILPEAYRARSQSVPDLSLIGLAEAYRRHIA